jgi:hypothetical protein
MHVCTCWPAIEKHGTCSYYCLLPLSLAWSHPCGVFITQNAHNVLIASSPAAPGGLVAKIADLGLSRVLKQDATHRTTRTVSDEQGLMRQLTLHLLLYRGGSPERGNMLLSL